MAKRPIKGSSQPPTHENQCRDVYGFTIRPQHLQLYKQYSAIYKEEEAERSARWESFLERYGESEFAKRPVREEDEAIEVTRGGGDDKVKVKIWGHIRPSLWPVEEVMRARLMKVKSTHETDNPTVSAFVKSEGFCNSGKEINASDNDSEEVTSNNETDETSASVPKCFSSAIEETNVLEEQKNEERNSAHCDVVRNANDNDREPCPWKDELDALVQGGVPMALRGEVWQMFVGTKRRRISGHYEALLTLLGDGGGDSDGVGGLYKGESNNYSLSEAGIFEKWTNQIEKDLPRTFPGHPALDVDGRNALRRLLTAYARHNPDVGYCQAMNFFAALLLLMMPEENAFWTLTGFIDDYFEGYYSEKMLESQVDQLVLDELVHKHFPRLVSHLDALGVQVAWVTGPWFLSIFVNILPWESVLRIWDVLLYDGNRSMLFRTALALLEQHGSAIMAAKDAGDALSLWQSLVGATFDSSQLVLIACMGYQFVDEIQLQELRAKNRPLVLAALSERSQWRSSKRSFSSKTFSNRGNSNGSQIKLADHNNDITNAQQLSIHEELENNSLPAVTVQSDDLDDDEICVADILEQVKWLKIELSRALVECKAANLRAEELETAFMELVKEDNRRSLTAKVESLEDDVAQLKQALAEKEEQEQAMLKVMLQMEQEQQAADDARRYAEDDAAAQRSVANAIQVKYEDAIVLLEDMEKRAVLAESMLTATLQYQALDSNFPVEQPKEINGEQSRWWPRFPMKPAEMPRTSEMPELADELLKMKGKTNQLPDLQKQGLLFRWREK